MRTIVNDKAFVVITKVFFIFGKIYPMASKSLQTERLVLKKITPAIIHYNYNTKSKADLIEFFGFSEDDYNHFLKMHEGGMETYRLSLLFFLLCRKGSNKVIGQCGYHTWNKSHNRAEVFYNLYHDEDKQQGLMSEALNAVLDFGFSEMNLHRIKALVADWNDASVAILKKFNFKFEGTMREDYLHEGKNEDSDCYSLLNWEWENFKQTAL